MNGARWGLAAGLGLLSLFAAHSAGSFPISGNQSVLPAGSELVVRALAPAAGATYQELGADLDRCLERALGGHQGDPLPGRGTVS